MKQTKHLGIRRPIMKGLKDGPKGFEVAREFTGFNVEDVDQQRYASEDIGTLVLEIVFHEGILSIDGGED